LANYPQGRANLSLLPISMRLAGPREAVWHAIIRKNYGCTHFIVGRDHAGPGSDQKGQPFYSPYAAQEMAVQHAAELGIEILPFQEMVYVASKASYVPIDEVKPGEDVASISGTEQRRRLQSGEEIPAWFSYPAVVAELRKSYPPMQRQGVTLFFTGLSGSGKSTIANAVIAKLMERGDRRISLLDGDLVRKHLSSELGFSREHRDLNITRIGYVASEITKHGGIAVCAPIAPYAATRRKVRNMVSAVGGFYEIHVATPIEVCEQRDRKGLYAKARAGIIKEFTGVSDPYEAPENPTLRIDTSALSALQAAERILDKLAADGYID
jgi:sulfate adenylyltransferase